MAGNAKISTKLIKEQLGKTPTMPKRTMAKLLRANHPKVFSSIDHARSAIKYYTGCNGKKDLINLADKRFVLPKATKTNPLSLPESDVKEWLPYILPDTLESIGIIGDVHVPYHDIKATTAALQYLQRQDIDCLVLNGDIADCYSLSSFEKNPELRDFPHERETVRHFLMAVRNMFPDIRIVYKEGNHEERFNKLLVSRAPDFYGISEFRLEVLFDLCNLGIDWVTEKRPIRYRELDILHGQELPCKSGGVNPARSALLKCRSNVIVNHFHRKTNDVQKTLRDEILQAWSVGMLCEKHPQYMPINDWSFGVCHICGGADWSVDNKMILNGKVV